MNTKPFENASGKLGECLSRTSEAENIQDLDLNEYEARAAANLYGACKTYKDWLRDEAEKAEDAGVPINDIDELTYDEVLAVIRMNNSDEDESDE